MEAGGVEISPWQLYFLRAGQDLRIFKSPSVYGVSAGKLSSGAEVFSDRAHTLMSEMKCGLL